jgi:formylglycine-generating enzyme required for sulfatase activity
MSVKKSSTYILSLRVGRVQTIVEEQLMKQFLMFRLNPKDAVVEVAGEPWIPNADGVCRKMLSYGTYDYRVKAKNYHDEVGKVTLNNAEETKVLDINLPPAYGWIEIKGGGDLSDAVVYIDDEMIGRAPIKTDKLSSGRHSVRIVKDLFRAHIEDVIVSDNQTVSFSPTLIGEFSNVSITTKSGAEIWVDGELKGTSSWSGRLSFGEHLMETKLASHRSQSRVVNIQPTESTKSVQLPEPQPIYGSLSVEVLPDFADIYIDGQKVGQTPKLISKIPIGDHKVEVRAEGKDPMEQTVTIREGAMSSVAGELKEETLKNQDELVFNVNGVKFTMKRVEGGTFTMGATPEQGSDAESDEKPAHQVTLDSYYIGVTEVTQALWQAVMGSNPSYTKGNSLPVDNVSWDDCQQFIQKLNRLTGQTLSLPTEAQWEFAARGGNLSRGYKYSGSNDLSSVAWYGNPNSHAHPVAQSQPNELGLYDMSGNVYEWCSDRYDSYFSSFPHKLVGSSYGSDRVCRGGCWRSVAQNCRVSFRSRHKPYTRDSILGLRLVLDSLVSSYEGSELKKEKKTFAKLFKSKD